MTQERIGEIFAALPHIQTIWVTKDGAFHLHEHNGGEVIQRPTKKVKEEPKVKEAVQEVVETAEEIAEVAEEVVEVKAPIKKQPKKRK